MKELTDLCGVGQSQLDGMGLEQLRETCIDVGNALRPSGAGIGIIVVMAAVGALVVLLVRLKAEEPAAPVVGTTIEGALYGALGAYGGLTAGLIAGDFMHPVVTGLLFAILAAVVVVLMIVAAARGDGGGGWKFFGFVQTAILASGLLTVTYAAFSVSSAAPASNSYSSYLNTVSVTLAITGGINGVIVAVARGAHWLVGWLLVPLNGSWGFIGNILGLSTHVASFNGYADNGSFKKTSDRRYYVCYEKGLSLKENTAGARFAFSQGAVMSSDDPDLEHHEGVHVLQHYIAGPLYPLSHFAWFIPMLIAGAIVGGVRSDATYDEGATAFGYYNNPWEVMAYGIINQSGRDTSKPMIWDWWLGVLCAVIWIALALAGAIAVIAMIAG